jgi:hypothetical protein
MPLPGGRLPDFRQPVQPARLTNSAEVRIRPFEVRISRRALRNSPQWPSLSRIPSEPYEHFWPVRAVSELLLFLETLDRPKGAPMQRLLVGS